MNIELGLASAKRVDSFLTLPAALGAVWGFQCSEEEGMASAPPQSRAPANSSVLSYILLLR